MRGFGGANSLSFLLGKRKPSSEVANEEKMDDRPNRFYVDVDFEYEDDDCTTIDQLRVALISFLRSKLQIVHSCRFKTFSQSNGEVQLPD